MSHSPILRRESSGLPKAGEGGRSEPAASHLTRWQSILSAHGGGAVSAELALDLVLHEIVEATREATHADAAAIALARDEEIVCRATTGEGAPGLGARLSGDTGLSAACVQTENWQRCDDTENDPRVDAELCRKLGVRSVLAVPVMRTGELLGVLEIFSGTPSAFSDREVRTLQMLSRSVVENIELARRATVDEAPAAAMSETAEQPGDTKAEGSSERETSVAAAVTKTADFWTGALMAAVVALAVIFGWMVGRGGRANSRAGVARQENQAEQKQVKTSAPADPVMPAAAPIVPAPTPTSSDLVVYQDGQKVFPNSTNSSSPDSKQLADLKPAAEVSRMPAGPMRLAPDVAAGYVTSRVEPEYPERARQRRVQGAVVLDAVVGKDGKVRRFAAIQGDPELAAAASTAVRQWRFRPLVRDGQSEEFQTRITVDFRLP